MKHVRKWLPVPTYDLPGMEGWLEEMAGKGLYLERLKSWTARFRKIFPRYTRLAKHAKLSQINCTAVPLISAERGRRQRKRKEQMIKFCFGERRRSGGDSPLTHRLSEKIACKNRRNVRSASEEGGTVMYRSDLRKLT